MYSVKMYNIQFVLLFPETGFLLMNNLFKKHVFYLKLNCPKLANTVQWFVLIADT